MKITYLNRKEGEKRFREVIWVQKLTLNHPSLINKGEEIKVLVDDKRVGERYAMRPTKKFNNQEVNN